MKAKEEILQKWDPVSRSMMNIHYRGPPPVISNVSLSISYPIYEASIGLYISDFSVSFDTVLYGNEPIQYSVFRVTQPDVPLFQTTTHSVSRDTSTTSNIAISGESYYAVLTYNDQLFKSSPVRIPLINILNFITILRADLDVNSTDYIITYQSTLNSVGTYTLFRNTTNSYIGAVSSGISTTITGQGASSLINSAALNGYYVFAQILFGGEVFLSSIAFVESASITITRFEINSANPSAATFTVDFSSLAFPYNYSQFVYSLYDNGTSQVPPYGGTLISSNSGLGPGEISSTITSSVVPNHYYYAKIVGGPVSVYSNGLIPPNASVSGLGVTYTDAVGNLTYTFAYNTSSVPTSTVLTYMVFGATNSAGAELAPLLQANVSIPSNATGTITSSGQFVDGHNYSVVKIFNGTNVFASSAVIFTQPAIYISSLTLGEIVIDYTIVRLLTVTSNITDPLAYSLYGTNTNSSDPNISQIISSGTLSSSPQTINIIPVYTSYFLVVLDQDSNPYSTYLVKRNITVSNNLTVISNMPTNNLLLYSIGYTSAPGTQIEFTLYGYDSGNGQSYDEVNNTVCSTQTSSNISGTFSGSFTYSNLLNSYYAKFVVGGLSYYSTIFNTPPPQQLIDAYSTNPNLSIVSPFSPLSARLVTGAIISDAYILSRNIYSTNNSFTLNFNIVSYPSIASSIRIELWDETEFVRFTLFSSSRQIYISVSDGSGLIYDTGTGSNAYDSTTQFTISRSSSNVFAFKKNNINIIPPYSFSRTFNNFYFRITPSQSPLQGDWAIGNITLTGTVV
jgi:hypothetical protein